MKRRILFCSVMALSALLFLPSCKKDGKTENSKTENNENGGSNSGGNSAVEDNDPVEATFTGSINHDTYTPEEKASCEFNRIPKTFEKFKEMFEKAAVEPQGAAAMFILSMEIYKQDAAVGEKCMAYTLYSKDLNDPNKVPGHEMSIIKQKLRGTDSYAQPYIATAYYEGATPSNQYTPEKYKVNFFVPKGKNYGPLSSAQSFVIPLKAESYGKDWNNNPNRAHNMAVVKPRNQQYYLVFEYMDLFISILAPDKN